MDVIFQTLRSGGVYLATCRTDGCDLRDVTLEADLFPLPDADAEAYRVMRRDYVKRYKRA